MKIEKQDKGKVSSLQTDQWLDILDALSIGAFTVNLSRKVTSINKTAQDLMGLYIEEVIGRDCRDIFLGVPCLSKCPVKSAQDPVSCDQSIEVKGRDNNRLLINRQSSPIYGPDQRVVGCFTILQDHTPITGLIKRIDYEERSFKIILDNLDIGLFTVNRGGYITFFNTAAEQITGFNRDQVLGRHCSRLLEGDASKHFGFLDSETDDGGNHSNREGSMLTRDGGTIPIRADYLALRNEKGKIVGGLVTFHDLTLMRQLSQAIQDQYTFHDMIGKSPEMQKIFNMVTVVAATDATVLIEGPTGTGKDLLTKVIHSSSKRSGKPMVKVNCAAIPETLLESELFGYEKGAFTGANQDKPGHFQEADGGTIFLDEIGDLPLPLQAKLLRVLEDKEFYPLGSRHTKKVDVRIISATNQDLKSLVKLKLFREDLFYRLNVFRIELPKLNDRRDDLPLLIPHIIRRLCSARASRPKEISKQAMDILLNYHYHGNIRELENILEHALIVCLGDLIGPEHLPDYIKIHQTVQTANLPLTKTLPEGRRETEREKILQALQAHKGHREETARSLGIDRTTLWRKMKRFDLLS